MSDRSSLVKGIQEYCGAFDHKEIALSRDIMIFGVVCFFAVLFFLIYIKGLTALSLVWFIVPVFITLLGYALSFDSSAQKTRRKLNKYRRQGILDEIADDFAVSEPRYNDALRIGKSAIFGRNAGEFAPLSRIAKISRVGHRFYHDGYLQRTVYFIEVKYKLDAYKLCFLNEAQCSDEKAWKVLSEDIHFQNNKTKIPPGIETRSTYSSSSSDD